MTAAESAPGGLRRVVGKLEPDVRRLVAADAVSFAGDMFRLTTLTLWVFASYGGSTANVGILVSAQYGAGLLATPLAGLVADRANRLMLLILADLIRAAMTVVMIVGVVLRLLPIVIVAVAISGGLTTLFEASRAAAMPDIVSDRSKLATTNSLIWTVEQVSVVIGPTAASGLYVTAGAVPALIADAVSFAMSALILRGIEHSASGSAGASAEKPVPTSRDAASRRRRPSRYVLALAFATIAFACMQAQFGVNNTVLVGFLPEDLKLPSSFIFLFGVVSGTIQLTCSAVLIAKAKQMPMMVTIAVSAGVVAVGGWILATAGNLWTTLAALAVIAIANVPFQVAFATMPQVIVSDRVLGRVAATIFGFGGIAYLLGVEVGSLVGGGRSPRESLIVSAIVLSVGAIAGASSLVGGCGRADSF